MRAVELAAPRALLRPGRPPQRRCWPAILRDPRAALLQRQPPAETDDPSGLRAVRSLHDLELDRLPLLQALESLALNRGGAHHHVLSSIRVDESVPLGLV